MIPSRKSQNKAAAVSRERRKLRLILLMERGPWCEACPVSPVGEGPPRLWEELHEVLTRGRGGSPTDPGNILCLCSPCHKWVTEHETEARELNLVRARTADEHRAALRPWEN